MNTISGVDGSFGWFVYDISAHLQIVGLKLKQPLQLHLDVPNFHRGFVALLNYHLELSTCLWNLMLFMRQSYFWKSPLRPCRLALLFINCSTYPTRRMYSSCVCWCHPLSFSWWFIASEVKGAKRGNMCEKSLNYRILYLSKTANHFSQCDQLWKFLSANPITAPPTEVLSSVTQPICSLAVCFSLDRLLFHSQSQPVCMGKLLNYYKNL